MLRYQVVQFAEQQRSWKD